MAAKGVRTRIPMRTRTLNSMVKKRYKLPVDLAQDLYFMVENDAIEESGGPDVDYEAAATALINDPRWLDAEIEGIADHYAGDDDQRRRIREFLRYMYLYDQKVRK